MSPVTFCTAEPSQSLCLRARTTPRAHTMVKAVQAEETVQAYFDGLIKAGAQAEVREVEGAACL